MRLNDRKFFVSKKVVQNLSKTVSIIILRPILAEISIVVTRVVKPLTTKVHPTVTGEEVLVFTTSSKFFETFIFE